MYTYELKPIKNFLEKNGFKEIKKYFFTNDKCEVFVDEDHLIVMKDMVLDNDTYKVTGKNPSLKFSEGISLYWLIGVLTSLNYIDKNYNI